jgi:hypothetical protein
MYLALLNGLRIWCATARKVCWQTLPYGITSGLLVIRQVDAEGQLPDGVTLHILDHLLIG